MLGFKLPPNQREWTSSDAYIHLGYIGLKTPAQPNLHPSAKAAAEMQSGGADGLEVAFSRIWL